jgi:phosphoserine phosphatase
VDGTLTTGDCVFPFLRRTGRRRLAAALLGRPLTFAGALLRRDRDRLKELACSALAGLPAPEVERLGVEFAHEIADRRLRDDTVARLRRHRELGHTVILASASLDPYLVPLAERLGAEKARRVREYLQARGLAGAELWAYGDSRDDEPLLESAEHGVRVGRRPLSVLDTGG